MSDQQALLEFADYLVATHTDSGLGSVQCVVLREALTLRTKAKTYDQIATETGYSGGYIKVIAAELWKLLSQVMGTKVTKGNVYQLLQQLEQGVLQDKEGPTEAAQIGPLSLQPTAPEGQESEGDRPKQSAILVVDDQPHNVALLTDIMAHDDYEVWQATDGAEALQMAVRVLPDLILLDVNLPDIDGYAVCQQLKADQRTAATPIIFVSSLDGSWDKVKGFSVGGSDYITKPFNTLEVIIRIENQLKIRQVQDQIRREAQAVPEAMRVSESTSSAAKAVILIVDDEPENLTLLTDVLEQEKYELWQADNGAEALRVAGMVLPDLILLDIKLPDMQGYDVCQQLKLNDRTKQIPVIFVSAIDKTWDKAKAFSVGGNDYVTKPIQVVELMARIEHQLQIWSCGGTALRH